MDLIIVFVIGACTSFIPIWILLSYFQKKKTPKKVVKKNESVSKTKSKAFTDLLQQECLERAINTLEKAKRNYRISLQHPTHKSPVSFANLSETYDLVAFLNESDVAQLFRDAVRILTTQNEAAPEEKYLKIDIALHAMELELELLRTPTSEFKKAREQEPQKTGMKRLMQAFSRNRKQPAFSEVVHNGQLRQAL